VLNGRKIKNFSRRFAARLRGRDITAGGQAREREQPEKLILEQEYITDGTE
jgi:hypothetical protein